MSHALTKSSTHSFNYVSSHALEASVGGGTAFIDWSIDTTNRKIITRNAGGVDIYDIDGAGFIATVAQANVSAAAYGSANEFTLSDPTTSENKYKTYDYAGVKLAEIDARDPLDPSSGNWYDTDKTYSLIPHGGSIVFSQTSRSLSGRYDSALSCNERTYVLQPIQLGSSFGTIVNTLTNYKATKTGGTSNGVTLSVQYGLYTISNNQLVAQSLIGGGGSPTFFYSAPISAFSGTSMPPPYLGAKYEFGGRTTGTNSAVTAVIHDNDGNDITSKSVGNSLPVSSTSLIASEMDNQEPIQYTSQNPLLVNNYHDGRYHIDNSGRMVDINNNTASYIWTKDEYKRTTAFSGQPNSRYPYRILIQECYWDNIILFKDFKVYVGKFNTDTKSITITKILDSLPIPRSVGYTVGFFFEENTVYYDHLESGSQKISKIDINTGTKTDIVVV